MNTIESTRIRGVMACELDDRLLAEVIADARIEAGEKIIDPKDIYPEHSALALDSEGKEFALINDEGVGGYGIDEVLAYYTIGEHGMYIYSVKVPVMALEDIDTEHKKVDLADFIRTFGGRLDNNHQAWVNWYNNPTYMREG